MRAGQPIKNDSVKRFLIGFLFCLCVCSPVSADIVRGTLVNDDDPYIVRATDGTLYKVEWYYGDTTWFEDDRVILTTDNGQGKMISTGFGSEKSADVYVEEVDED